jgi:hypothetical protein
MGTLRSAGVVAAAAVVAAVVTLVLIRGSAPPAAPTVPVAVRASFDQRVAQLGDPVTARVVVALDRGAVRPETLHVADDVTPFTPLAAATTTRARSGRLETITETRRVVCLTAPCLAGRPALPRVRVVVARRDGGSASAATAWRAPLLRSRVGAKDVARATPRLAADTAPPAPSYRLAPSTVETALRVVAALAAAGAAALLALQAIAMLDRRRRVEDHDDLAHALRLVREAEQRPVPDRRRALASLARLLRNRDDADLGRAASELAWSQPAPEPPAVDALVDRVEQERTA